MKIDSIYYFDYTGQVGYYQSVRDFRSEKMTYMSLALSTPKISVNATPTIFKIGKPSSEKVREFITSHMDDLKKISKLLKDFENYTYEYTLYPVSNGNFSETPIDAEDFKKICIRKTVTSFVTVYCYSLIIALQNFGGLYISQLYMIKTGKFFRFIL